MPRIEANRTALKPRCSGRPKVTEIEQRDAHILQVAGETFLHAGFDGTTMDAVTEAARISKRTLYARYADKTILFNAVLHDLIRRWFCPVDQLQFEHGELRDTLLALARYLTTSALSPQAIGINRIIISEAQRRPEFARLANDAGRKPAIRVIASILRHHQTELRPMDLDMAAEQFMCLAVDSNLHRAHLGVRIGRRRIQQWVCAAVDLFLTGARHPEAAAHAAAGTAVILR